MKSPKTLLRPTVLKGGPGERATYSLWTWAVAAGRPSSPGDPGKGEWLHDQRSLQGQIPGAGS